MEELRTLTAKELKQKIDAGEDMVIVDVLSAESYGDHHVPGAVNIPIRSDDFKADLEKGLPNKNRQVIVYCSSHECTASPAAAKMLMEMGYSDVIEFAGGIKEWEESGFDFE